MQWKLLIGLSGWGFCGATATVLQSVFSTQPVFASCTNSQLLLSCTEQALSSNDSCCVENKSGLILLAQFWDIHAGYPDQWTIHGLWTDYCTNSTWPEFCDDSRAHSNITAILQSRGKYELLQTMNNVWPNSEGLVDSLWFHEWNKHGTCMTTLEPGCTSSDKLELDSYQGIIDYFSSAVDLYSRFPVFQALARRNILPGRIYQTTLVASAIEEELGILPNLQCDTNGTLSELWLYFYVKGPIKYLEFYPTQPDSTSSCNVSLYYPKKYPSNPYPVTNVIP